MGAILLVDLAFTPAVLRHGLKARRLWVYPFTFRRNLPFRIDVHWRGGLVYTVALRMEPYLDISGFQVVVHDVHSSFSF